MKAIGIALVALLATLVATQEDPVTSGTEADQDVRTKQRDIMKLLSHVKQKSVYEDVVSIGDSYGNNLDVNDYQDPEVVQRLVDEYRRSLLLAPGEIFSILDEDQAEQTEKLYQVFIGAKDYATFYKVASLARNRINQGVFLAALSSAVLHRDDTSDILLPPPYETAPNKFAKAQILQNAIDSRLRRVETPLFIYYNPDTNLQYFTEDPGLNSYNVLYSYEYPLWLFNRTNRGELFIYSRKQLLARYNFHRLSVGLPEVEPFVPDVSFPIKQGYYSNLRYDNGLPLTGRPPYVAASPSEVGMVDELKITNARLREATEAGTFIAHEGGDPQKTTRVFVRDLNYDDALGNMIEGNRDSLNKQYFGSYYQTMLKFVGHPLNIEIPGASEHFETMLGDPIYYEILQQIVNVFEVNKEQLPSYTTKDMTVPGMNITSVNIDPLTTSIENFTYSLNNAIDVADEKEISDLDYNIKHPRLYSAPFTTSITVSNTNDKPVPAVIRVYLAPKRNADGQELSFEGARPYIVELDRFHYNIQPGENIITRSSTESSAVVPDLPSTRSLINQTEGNEPFDTNERNRQCGLPQNLLLPMGTTGGLEAWIITVISEAGDQEANVPAGRAIISCGAGIGNQELDNKALGYPFDRPIPDGSQITDTPNIYMKEVLIYHKA